MYVFHSGLALGILLTNEDLFSRINIVALECRMDFWLSRNWSEIGRKYVICGVQAHTPPEPLGSTPSRAGISVCSLVKTNSPFGSGEKRSHIMILTSIQRTTS